MSLWKRRKDGRQEPSVCPVVKVTWCVCFYHCFDWLLPVLFVHNFTVPLSIFCCNLSIVPTFAFIIAVISLSSPLPAATKTFPRRLPLRFYILFYSLLIWSKTSCQFTKGHIIESSIPISRAIVIINRSFSVPLILSFPSIVFFSYFLFVILVIAIVTHIPPNNINFFQPWRWVNYWLAYSYRLSSQLPLRYVCSNMVNPFTVCSH